MLKTLFVSALKLLTASALLLTASQAAARSDVSWSVTVGSPYTGAQVYAPPPPVVYVEPQPVYVQPRPVYVQPRPVYVQPRVVQYGQPYYVEAPRRHWKHHRDHHWRHDRHHRHDRHEYRHEHRHHRHGY